MKLVTELDPAKPILVYCGGGVRSRLALGKLKDAGFTRIYNLNRGMLGWMLGGHPVESPPH